MISPKVSIIVTSFLEQSKPYLDLCMRSIKNLNYDNFETIIVSPKNYTPKYDTALTVTPEKDPYFNSHALNFGAEKASKDSDYFFFLNDDVILTKNCLTNLVSSAKSVGDFGLFMPVSNDMQMKYYLPIPYMSSGPYRLEALEAASKDYAQVLMNADSFYNQGLIFSDVLCLYAVLIPRDVFSRIGEFADGWKDDWDYTKRVVNAGLFNVICMNSLAYHAGGVSSEYTLGPLDSKERMDSLKTFEQKWGENVNV